MLQLTVLDRHGHSVITQEVETEYKRLIADGYAAFLNNEQITELPTAGDVLMLAPLAGG